MSKKHDESKDLRLFARIGKIDYSSKILKASKKTTIGNKMWGRIDFLTHYCDWHFIWDNSVGVRNNINIDNADRISNITNARKAAKERSLTDKRNKRKQV